MRLADVLALADLADAVLLILLVVFLLVLAQDRPRLELLAAHIAIVLLPALVDVEMRRTVGRSLEAFVTNRTTVRTLVSVAAEVNLQIRPGDAPLAACLAREPLLAHHLLHVILQQPFGGEALVAVVLTGEQLVVAELHVTELLEVGGEALLAVPAAVQQILLLEDVRMLVADVLGEEADLLDAFEAAIVQRTENDVRVEEQQVNLHLQVRHPLLAMSARDEQLVVLDQLLLVEFREGSKEVILVRSPSLDQHVLNAFGLVVMLGEVSHNVVFAAESDPAIGAREGRHERCDGVEVLMGGAMDGETLVILKSDAAAVDVEAFPLVLLVHVLL